MNFNELMKRAKEVQEKMEVAQREIKKIEVTGTAGGDMVTVKFNGQFEVLAVHLTDEALTLSNDPQEQKKLLGNLIASAVNDAISKVRSLSSSKIADLTKGMDLPKDLKLPNDE